MQVIEYLRKNKKDIVSEASALLEEMQEYPLSYFPSKEEIIGYLFTLASKKEAIYNAGFDEALELVNNVNGKFLTMELPPHLKR